MLSTTASKRFLDTRTLVTSSLLNSISIILTRFFAVMIPLGGLPALRLGFGQIPIAITGILFGPLAGGITGAVADLIGFMINPHGGPFFPGFTLSSILWGVVPGLFYMVIKKYKVNFNFNILNTVFILLLAFGLSNLLFSRDILSFENGKLMIQGDTMYTVLIVLSTFVVITFIVVPFIISRRFKYNNKVYDMYSIDKIIFTVTIPYIFISLGLNTLWLSIMYDKGFMIFLPGRILAGVFVIPIFSTFIYVLSKFFRYANK